VKFLEASIKNFIPIVPILLSFNNILIKNVQFLDASAKYSIPLSPISLEFKFKHCNLLKLS
jgi:hypothetical protein